MRADGKCFSLAGASFCFYFASHRGRARDQQQRGISPENRSTKKVSESNSRLNSVASLARQTCFFLGEREAGGRVSQIS